MVGLALALTMPPPGWAQASGSAQQAGNISALLPVARIVRGPAPQPTISVAKTGDAVIWNDLLRTEKGGRARVTLLDQSVLSVGSQSELRIVKHDPRSQQTALELNYGRVRAEVTPVTRGGGQFQIKTPTAVAGVIGTDFGMTSGLDSTEFVCLSGAVTISSGDPNVPGAVTCHAGETVTVMKGKPPSQPRPATAAQMNAIIQDTEPAAMGNASPGSAVAGSTLDVNVSGVPSGASFNAVAVAGTGVQASVNPNPAALSLHLIVDPQAAPGPRTITLAGGSEPVAVVFAVLAKPAAGGQETGTSFLPQVDQAERTVEFGAMTGFDASMSRARGGAQLSSFQWVLCDSSYHPAQVGVPLGPNAPACSALAGYTSSSPQFQISTCALAPGDYTARLNVTDANGNRSALDVRLTIAQPGYDDPATRLRNLAQAYSALQQAQFMQFFDPVNYPGYSTLQENVRTTLASLSSMTINLQPAQAEVGCQQAVVRTTWIQKYSYKSNPAENFNQTEGLTVRFSRTPGTGWLITDFQGDNGTLQGIPPGVSATGLSGGIAPDQISLTSDRNNASGAGSAAAPVQLNGLLAETIDLELKRATCSSAGACPGSADLRFSADPALLANVSGANGKFVPQPELDNVPYYTSQPVSFAAALDGNGQVTAQPAQAAVSMTAVTIPATGPQMQLLFNIGDIDLLAPSCTYLPPAGATTRLAVQWVPVNGFNASPLTWQWASLPQGITADRTEGTSSGSGTYPELVFQLTNANAADLGGTQTADFQASITNASGTATKHWQISLGLSASACGPTGQTRASQAGVPSGRPQAAVAPASRLRGSWGKDAGGAVSAAAPAAALPDLQIVARDVTYTPSVPKSGDTVEVRFRVTNAGNADAVRIPIALRVNGVVAASDTFDVAAGRTTLGGLRWNNAQVSAAGGSVRATPGAAAAELVIDPGQTTHQKTNVGKSAVLPHFTLAGASAASLANRARLILILGEGACAGVRFSNGVSGCASGDVSITVDDLAAGRYSLNAPGGIADLGFLNPGASSAPTQLAGLSPAAAAVAGHTYAVSLKGNKLGILTLVSVRNPHRLSSKSDKVFGKGGPSANPAAGPRLSGRSDPPRTGDVAPVGSDGEKVYFELTYSAGP
jgi:hypothetical protein